MSNTELLFLFIGISFFIGGIGLKLYPPKKFSMWGRGVRFPSAMRNQKTWNEANRFVALPLAYAGLGFIGLLILSKLLFRFNVLSMRSIIIIVLMTIMILLVFTNRHLDRLFDKDGNPK